mgnify:CR=1
MKIGIISLGGESSIRILDAAKKFFSTVDSIPIKNLHASASAEGFVISNGMQPLPSYDCLYIRGSYKYAILQHAISTAYASTAYMPLAPKAFQLAHDKFLTMLELQSKGIRIPKTWFTSSLRVAKQILDDVTYPVILKIPSGTQGKGVMIADSKAAASSMLDALELFKQPYIIQEYIDTGGTDIRALVIGRKVIAMSRKAGKDELRANIHLGAKGYACQLDADTEQIALRSAKIIGASICAVDILLGNKPSVIELNASPGLQGIMKTTKQNIPHIIAEYLAHETRAFTTTKNQHEQDQVVPTHKSPHSKKVFTTLSMKEGIIRLPKFVSDIGQFTMDDEISITVEKGKVLIKEHSITKED